MQIEIIQADDDDDVIGHLRTLCYKYTKYYRNFSKPASCIRVVPIRRQVGGDLLKG